MRVLLDTHTWLWLQTTPERLGGHLTLARDPGTELLLSAASVWEIAIKYELGKLALPDPPARYVAQRMATSGVVALPVSVIHAFTVATLPPHHRDPFDRLLVAQAQVERTAVLTADPAFHAYEVDVLRIA